MADENKKSYVLAADGMRLDGRRYRRGDKVELDAEQGDRLVESGSLVENEDDLPDRDPGTAPTAGLADVAEEKSTLYAGQSIDDDGNVLESSFGHPDRVEEAEKRREEQDTKADATRSTSGRRRTADTSTATTADTTADTSTATADTGEAGSEKPATRTRK